ncbi:hypothetical protein BFW01_g3 [Lasiodiplodia theobromae]|uniref:Uncharacterized protein n=1 Tax=Lasiodiplodia theobromae TaxID=45133 RepID=A0A8H7IR72_9PEZI|nr:hypothetical protein BFW01_g3 [Lasiodiplodia theobromae]
MSRMYYHAAILLLFRPFLKARFTESNVSPREVCRQSANTISYLFEKHRQLFGLDGIFTFQLHCLLTACTIHIIKLPSISATSHLAAACNSFQDLVKHNQWATSSLDIIRSLVQKWKIVLPLEVEHALYRDQSILPALSESTSIETNNPSDADLNTQGGANLVDRGRTPISTLPSSRPEKREARFPSPPAGSHILPKRQRLAAPHFHDCENSTQSPIKDTFSSNQQPLSTTGAPAAAIMSTVNSSTTATHQQRMMRYLFAPFPHQPAPLLGPVHTSTSHNGWEDEDGTDRRDTWTEELRRVSQGFDGLNFVADDGFDPFMGYQGDRF